MKKFSNFSYILIGWNITIVYSIAQYCVKVELDKLLNNSLALIFMRQKIFMVLLPQTILYLKLVFDSVWRCQSHQMGHRQHLNIKMAMMVMVMMVTMVTMMTTIMMTTTMTTTMMKNNFASEVSTRSLLKINSALEVDITWLLKNNSTSKVSIN